MDQHIIQGGPQRDQEAIILLAEDDEGHAGLIRRNLARAGIANTIRHFLDGEEVHQFLFSQQVSTTSSPSAASYILLLDIHMPKMNGIELLRQLKADPELHKLPIVMITTSDDPREMEECRALGCRHFMTKPVDYESFAAAIQELGLLLAVMPVPKITEAGRTPETP